MNKVVNESVATKNSKVMDKPAICQGYGSSEQTEEHGVQSHVAFEGADPRLRVYHWPDIKERNRRNHQGGRNSTTTTNFISYNKHK